MSFKLIKNFKKNIFFYFLILFLISLILFLINLKIKNTPIKIGFVSTLTTPASISTLRTKDIVTLAVEIINRNGGINGRKIELIIKDDKFDPDTAYQVDQELIDEGVVAIIGHSFSFLCLKVAPLMNKNNIVMITPTSQSTELNGVDDNIFRILFSSDKDAKITAYIASNMLKLKKIAIIYDALNKELSDQTSKYLKQEFEKLGGKVSVVIEFNSTQGFSAPVIAEDIIKSGAEGVYLITDAIHTALISQHLRIKGSEIKIISHGWAFNDPDLIVEGGKAVEEMMSINIIDINLANKNFLSFVNEYKEKFETDISGPSLLVYLATQILYKALLNTTNPKKLKNVILKQKEFDSLDGKISFDKFGDPMTDLNIMQIKDGKLQTIKKISKKELLNLIYTN